MEVERTQEVVKVIKEIVEVPVVIYMPAEKSDVFGRGLAISSLAEESDEMIFKKLNAMELPKSEEPIMNQLLLQSNYPI